MDFDRVEYTNKSSNSNNDAQVWHADDAYSAFIAGGMTTRLLDKVKNHFPDSSGTQAPTEYSPNKPNVQAPMEYQPEQPYVQAATEYPSHKPNVQAPTEFQPRNPVVIAEPAPERRTPVNPQDPSPYLPQKNGFDTSILIGGAVLGGAHSAACWGFDHAYAKLPESEKATMSWWKPHSEVLQKTALYEQNMIEARVLNESIAKQLEEHKTILDTHRENVENLAKQATQELESRTSAKQAVDLIDQQRAYVEHLGKIARKAVVPGESIGRAADIESGASIFEKNSELGKAVRKYQDQLFDTKVSKRMLGFYKKDVTDMLDAQYKNLGELANTTHSDLVHYNARNNFYSNFPDNNIEAIKSKIGTVADLQSGKAIVISGSEEANLLHGYMDSFAANQKLMAKSLETSALVKATETQFAAQIARGPGSILGRTVCGTGRGLLVAAGMMALGYAFDQIAAALSPEK